MTLEEHFVKFHKLIRDLEAVGCKMDEGDKVWHLLLTLLEKYEVVIAAIETMLKNVKLEFVKCT